MCQCPLFKQFTTRSHDSIDVVWVFIVCVNVLFLSNSQLTDRGNMKPFGVYRMCQCPLFKQFTTTSCVKEPQMGVFIVCVNVLFLSNSQRLTTSHRVLKGVYRMCQCPLFKQFTTLVLMGLYLYLVFIVCVNVLFLSNSQLIIAKHLNSHRCLSYVSMSSF